MTEEEKPFDDDCEFTESARQRKLDPSAKRKWRMKYGNSISPILMSLLNERLQLNRDLRRFESAIEWHCAICGVTVKRGRRTCPKLECTGEFGRRWNKEHASAAIGSLGADIKCGEDGRKIALVGREVSQLPPHASAAARRAGDVRSSDAQVVLEVATHHGPRRGSDRPSGDLSAEFQRLSSPATSRANG